MDEQNGDCFDHHEALFAPLSSSDTEHDCLKDFLLDPPRHEQHNLSGGYCYDNGLQNMQGNHGLMPMTLNSGLPMQMGSGLPMAGSTLPMAPSNMSLAGSSMSTGHGMQMAPSPSLSMQRPGLSLGSPMGCGLPMSHNVSMSMNSGPVMSMAGNSGLAMPQNPCMPLSPNTNMSIPNHVLPMSSPSPLSMTSNTGLSPGMSLPMSTGSLTMPTCSPISMVSEHSLPMSNNPGRPFLDHIPPISIPSLPSCVNDNSMNMHQAFQSNHHHISQLKSPVQLVNTNMDFRSPGHTVESVIPSALDNGVMLSECSEKNGEWSPAGTGDSIRTGESQEGVEPGTSERTVSSDCVSSETMCSPEAEGQVDHGNDERKVKQETRGRKRKTSKQPRQKKSPSTIATYQSQIPPDQNGIKIRIKKSLTLAPQKTRKRRSKQNEVSDEYVEPLEQSPWGDRMPKKVLNNIFYMVTKIEGCVPFLVR